MILLVKHQWSLDLRACQAGLFQPWVIEPTPAWPQQRETYRLSSRTRWQLDPEAQWHRALVSLTQSLAPLSSLLSFSLGRNHSSCVGPSSKRAHSQVLELESCLERNGLGHVGHVSWSNHHYQGPAISSFIHLFNTYLLSIYFVPKTFLGAEDRAVNKTDKQVSVQINR